MPAAQRDGAVPFGGKSDVSTGRARRGILPKMGPLSESQRKQVFRLAEEPSAQELAEIQAVVEVDSEAYLRWLESGEGPDPCEVAFSR